MSESSFSDVFGDEPVDETQIESARPLRDIIDGICDWQFMETDGRHPNCYTQLQGKNDTKQKPPLFIQSLKSGGDRDLNANFSDFLKAVVAGFIVQRHPFVLRIIKWSPLDIEGQPGFVILTKFYQEGSLHDMLAGGRCPRQPVPILYCIARALIHFQAMKVRHGHVCAKSVFVSEPNAKREFYKARLGLTRPEASADDFEGFRALCRQMGFALPPDISQFSAAAEFLERSGDVRGPKNRADGFQRLQSSRAGKILSPSVLFALNGPGPEKWKQLRDLQEEAAKTPTGEICAWLGLIYECGIGIDRDGSRAYDYYSKCESDPVCRDRRARLIDPASPPQIRGQVFAKLGQVENAVAAFRQCTDPLGLARFGEFLMASADAAARAQGRGLLEAAAARGCGFASFCLGKFWITEAQPPYPSDNIAENPYSSLAARRTAPAWNPAALNNAFTHLDNAFRLGYPDAAFLMGCACCQRGSEEPPEEQEGESDRLDGPHDVQKWFRTAATQFHDPLAKELVKRFDEGLQ
jgi:hypothetical protein